VNLLKNILIRPEKHFSKISVSQQIMTGHADDLSISAANALKSEVSDFEY
jgi:hypothetical protein